MKPRPKDSNPIEQPIPTPPEPISSDDEDAALTPPLRPPAVLSDAEDAARWGIDIAALGISEKRTWGNQQRFLSEYRKHRTQTNSAKYAGVFTQTVDYWRKHNSLNWNERFAEADKAFLDDLEQFAVSTARAMKPGQSPILLLAILNANLPEKYRPNWVTSDETAQETLDELRKLAREVERARGEKPSRQPVKRLKQSLAAGQAQGDPFADFAPLFQKDEE